MAASLEVYTAKTIGHRAHRGVLSTNALALPAQSGKIPLGSKIDWRIGHGYWSWRKGAGFYAAEPGQERSEALGFCGQEKCGAGVVSAGLEPDLHERACVFRERHEIVRVAGCGSAGNQRGQHLVAQGLRGENGHQIFVAGGFSSQGRGERKIWPVFGR